MLGILGVVLGVMTLAPLAARPLAAAIGAPLRLRGLPGDLARQNAMRNPRRTASTAAALMIGLTLVVSMGVFASSLKASFSGILGDSTNADLYLTTASAQAEGTAPRPARRQPRCGVEAGVADRLRRGPDRRGADLLLVGRPCDGGGSLDLDVSQAARPTWATTACW